ncbi:MAG: pyruvate formate-lyase, partial [Clostridia bacterium]|nr:pyruvate formate-lyase [Clostridia bacterium]
AKPLVSGGVRYMAGTYETYGNTTVADSFTAIREMVYEKKLLTLRELVDILDADFAGHEDLRQKLLRCPKFGNDDPVADAMAKAVNTHVFETTARQAKAQGLSSYLVVMINNGANVDLGKNTLATADGRRAFTFLSNGNNPMAGQDHKGLPALLRSIASTRMELTAGTAQNLKLTKDLFTKHPDAVRDLIDTAFDMGILSLNISVLSRGEMEDAMIHPELHQNLFVRVGGFSARFVNLDPGTQADMLARALY